MTAAELWQGIKEGKINPYGLTFQEYRDLVLYLVPTWRETRRKKSFVPSLSAIVEALFPTSGPGHLPYGVSYAVPALQGK